MSGSRDAPSLTNKPCQGEDLNNVPQLLYYSVFVRGFTLPFNAIKACCFSYTPASTSTSPPVCVCVCQLWHRLVMSDMLKQSRTHIRSNRQPESATVPKHAVSILSSNFLWSVISQTATHTNTPTGKTRIHKKPLLQPSVWHRCCLCARHLQEYICNLSGGKQC